MSVSFDVRGFWFAIKFFGILFLAIISVSEVFLLFQEKTAERAIQAPVKTGVNAAAVLPEENPRVQLAFVGDIMLDRGVKQKILAEGGGDFNFSFRKIYAELQNYDLLFGNLEGPISARGADAGSLYSFRMTESAASAIKNAGFDVVSIANNHIGDWGEKAIFDTIFYLNNSDIQHIGAGFTQKEALGARILKKANTKFAFLAFNDAPTIYREKPDEIFVAAADPQKIAEYVRIARDAADVVIVSFHFGEEYQAVPSVRQKFLAYLAIDSGADLVIGHHPHVIQPIERYKNGWIVYSLGNFVFDQDFSSETMAGLLLEAEVGNKKILKIHEKTVRINKLFQPYFNE